MDKRIGKATKVDYKPIMVKNTTSFELELPGGGWLQPKHVTTMDEYDGKIKGLEIVK